VVGDPLEVGDYVRGDDDGRARLRNAVHQHLEELTARFGI
jgi:hypothetical protein